MPFPSPTYPPSSCAWAIFGGMTWLTRGVWFDTARVLDDKLKRERNEKMHPATGSGRKRSRMSGGSH